MTDTEVTTATDASLRGRLAHRREALRHREPFFVPVPGYEDILAAKYHAIDYRTLRRIGMRQADNKDVPESEIAVAADTLATACDGFYEVPAEWDGDESSLRDTGYTWDVRAARDLFGVGEDELPDGSTARAAILAIVPDHTEVILHYGEYDREARAVNKRVSEELQGESEAS